MEASRLNAILARLPALRLGVLGDFCLDAYWTFDESAAEVSVETGLATQPVRQQRYSPGGAGTIAANLVALGVGRISAFGVLGADPFGHALRELLSAQRIDVAGLRTQAAGWDTPVYLKPLRDGAERSRIDIGNFNALADDVAAAVLAQVEAALPELDGLIVNEQLRQGLHTPFVQRALQALLDRHADRLIVVDSRHFPERYPACIHKFNAREAARLEGHAYPPGAVVPQSEVEAYARALHRRWGRPVFITNGAHGCVVASDGHVAAVRGLRVAGPIDPVGAGDSLLAGVTAALAGAATPLEAATFGNFAAGVTVQKLFQTGTASPDEIRAIGTNPVYR